MHSSGLPGSASVMAMNWAGLQLDPYPAFNFVIEIEGLLVGGFSEANGLESTVETEEVREGGVNNFVHYLPGQTTHANLVLRHGLTLIDTLWNWYFQVTQGNVVRRNGTILLLNAQLAPVMWWNFRNAYPVRWTGPSLNAADGEIAFEEVELVHEGLTAAIAGKPGSGR